MIFFEKSIVKCPSSFKLGIYSVHYVQWFSLKIKLDREKTWSNKKKTWLSKKKIIKSCDGVIQQSFAFSWYCSPFFIR